MRPERVLAGVGALALGVGGVMAQGVELLVWDRVGGLGRVTTSPPTYTFIGNSGEAALVAEIELGDDGILYANETTNNAELHRLDPTDGSYIDTVLLTFPPEGNVITAMEWIDGLLWCGLTTESGGGLFHTFLVTLDPDAGYAMTVVGDTGINFPWGGIAYDGSDMYAVTSGGSTAKLYTVSFAGVATLVGEVMEGANPAPRMTALEFGPDGVLYAMPNASSLEAGSLYRIDPASAQAVNLGDTGNFNLIALTTSPGVGPCSVADLAVPFGQLDFSDVLAFLSAFGAMEPAADLAPPTGVWDFSDVIAYLSAFGAGCP